MIDQFLVITRGGLVLFNKTFAPVKGGPVECLIKEVLIEERSGENVFTQGPYNLRWTFNNQLGVIFVVVYQKIVQLLFIEDMLEMAKASFCKRYREQILESSVEGIDYDDKFDKVLTAMEQKQEEAKRPKMQQKYPGKKVECPSPKAQKKAEPEPEPVQDEDDGNDEDGGSDDEMNENTEEDERARILANRAKLLKARGGKKPPPAKKEEPVEPKKKKEMRKWDGSVSKEEAAALDRSKKVSAEEMAELAKRSAAAMDLSGQTSKVDLESDSDSDLEEADEAAVKKKSGMLGSFFQTLTGNRVLDEDDLEPVLKKLKEGLMAKNVAQDVSEDVCASVSKSLAGVKLTSFTSVTSTVKTAMEGALTRVLTPKKNTDMLREIMAKKQRGLPYTLIFCGVNGVGKSTTLSKIAFWLKQNKLSILIAACDTFRAGAVEQLRKHCNNLDLHLYEKGYGKDAANIARDAVKYAEQEKIDVVLVDTAGRMQDNEPLMRSLAKLVHINNPDLVLFVGEALVGNDAVDQVKKFNQSLAEYSTVSNPRLLDGLILTKFDTIDEKVGAAVSMVYATGQPIFFVGCGQNYTDIKKLNVKSVVRSLLK